MKIFLFILLLMQCGAIALGGYALATPYLSKGTIYFLVMMLAVNIIGITANITAIYIYRFRSNAAPTSVDDPSSYWTLVEDRGWTLVINKP